MDILANEFPHSQRAVVKKFLGVFFLGYLIYVFVRDDGADKAPAEKTVQTEENSKTTNKKKLESEKADVTPREVLLMRELSRVYSENINLFNQRYVFQSFDLRGEVTDIEPMSFAVRIGGSGRAATKYYVECASTGTDPKLVELRKGQTVDFTGMLATADKTLGTLTLTMAGCVIR